MNKTNTPRRAKTQRKTAETDIRAELCLDGDGKADIRTGAAFFDHMLSQTALHGGLDITLAAKGDMQIDAHHTIEDCGIVLGGAFAEALGDKRGIRRFGYAYAPLDESLARVVVDICGRSALTFNAAFSREEIGGLDADLLREFFKSFADNARVVLHIDLLRGVNAHHQAEAIFKAFGLALGAAVCLRGGGGLPSTKKAL
ncbi:MAG: imidazoleglycerol-phosphate dehydratase HisB [Gammaproteobacteria bacterium]